MNGVLPFQGSLADQPNHIIEIFRVLDKLKFDHQQELRAKAEKQNG